MNRPILLIVTGLPGTGKTTLSKKIARELKMPLLTKDTIKESLFDDLGWSDRDWSRKVGMATFHILDYIIEEQMRAGHSLIHETNMSPRLDGARFRKWQDLYGYTTVQVVCQTEPAVLARRFTVRAQTDRHPGHTEAAAEADEAVNLANLKMRIDDGEDQPLALKGTVIFVDTTDFQALDEQGIIAQIRAVL